ncbi:MAG: alpha/beta hydrolase family protein [Planctomycetota bacterium]
MVAASCFFSFRVTIACGLALLASTLCAQSPSVPSLLPSMKSEDWPERRRAIIDGMERVMGKLPSRAQLPEVTAQILSQDDSDPDVRVQSIRFESEPGNWVPAYLLIPINPPRRPMPAVLCLHQTIAIGKGEPVGLGGSPNLHYAIELARRGFLILAPDYPSFGDYKYDFAKHPQWQSGSLKAVWDNMRGIDMLTRRPDVDAGKIGCIGHSLGGHNTIFTAVFDERIGVAISSCGFTRFHKYYGGKLQGWTSDRYMPRIASEYGSNPDRMPFDFPQLLAAIAPRAFFSSSPQRDDNFDCQGVRETVDAAREIFQLLDAPDRLQVLYPDCEHDFPESSREAAYRFLEQHLK